MDRRQWCFILAASILFAIVVIQWSYRFGRLSMDPVYDDVVYLLDARARLVDFDQQGIAKLVKSLWHEPPHSPWSTTAALAGFLLFGVNAWAPYAVNTLLVIGFLLAADHFFGIKEFWPRALISLVILALPMTVRAIHDFRPDFALALITSIACLKSIEIGVLGREIDNPRRPLVAGLFFGLAYLVKPSFVYHTTAMLLVSLGVAEAFLLGNPLRIRRSLLPGLIRRLGIFFAGCVAVCGLYYVKNWKEILAYVSANTGSGKQASIWKIPGGMWVTLKAYVISGDMAEMLGPFLWIILPAIVVGTVFTISRRKWSAAALISGALICALVSLGIMCVGQIYNPFFGLTWQILAVLAAIISVGTLDRENALRGATIAFALAIGLTRVFQPPFRKVYQTQPDGMGNQSLNKALVKRFEELLPVNPVKRRPSIFVSFAGVVVDAYAQQWVAEDARYPANIFEIARSGDIALHRQMIATADIVEVASEDAYWVADVLPSSHLRKELLAMMRSDPSFFETPPVRGQGGTVYLFVRKNAFRGAS
jgi:hypothetical protein